MDDRDAGLTNHVNISDAGPYHMRGRYGGYVFHLFCITDHNSVVMTNSPRASHSPVGVVNCFRLAYPITYHCRTEQNGAAIKSTLKINHLLLRGG